MKPRYIALRFIAKSVSSPQFAKNGFLQVQNTPLYRQIRYPPSAIGILVPISILIRYIANFLHQVMFILHPREALNEPNQVTN